MCYVCNYHSSLQIAPSAVFFVWCTCYCTLPVILHIADIHPFSLHSCMEKMSCLSRGVLTTSQHAVFSIHPLSLFLHLSKAASAPSAPSQVQHSFIGQGHDSLTPCEPKSDILQAAHSRGVAPILLSLARSGANLTKRVQVWHELLRGLARISMYTRVSHVETAVLAIHKLPSIVADSDTLVHAGIKIHHAKTETAMVQIAPLGQSKCSCGMDGTAFPSHG